MTASETETALIGALVGSPEDAMPVAKRAGVRAEWFADEVWAVVWKALDRLWGRGLIASADAVSVMTEARRVAAEDPKNPVEVTVERIQGAIDATPVMDPSAHCIDLRNAYVERCVAKKCGEWAKRRGTAADASIPASDLVKGIGAILAEGVENKKIEPARVLDGVLAKVCEAYHMRVDPNGPRDLTWVPGFRMPWPEITNIYGGLRPGLHVIAARPSVGKTSCAINLMRYWCERGRGDGKPSHVVFDSLDMPREEALSRFLAEKARVSFRKLYFSPTLADIEAAKRANEVIGKWPLTVVEIRDVDDLRSFCMIEREAKRLDILVVDYLGQLHNRSKEDAVEYARVSYASDTLKNMAAELQIPIVALCQLNRESAKADASGMPGLTDLRGSGTIEQDAFTVSVLYRDDKVVNSSWKDQPPTFLMPGCTPYGVENLDAIWWDLIKAQNAGHGKFPFVVRKNYFAWSLGNYKAAADVKEEGFGATKKQVIDNTAKFAKVHADWRHDPIEEILRKQGTLIEASENVGGDEGAPVAEPARAAASAPAYAPYAPSAALPSAGAVAEQTDLGLDLEDDDDCF